jgi:hypothetical protein
MDTNTKEDEMSRACSTPEGKRHLTDIGMDRRVVLK